MINNNEGLVTVKLLLIVVSMITVFTVLLQGLTLGFNNNHDLRNKKLLADHILADYDTYLYVNYGLYGAKHVNNRAVFNHSLAKSKVYEPILIKDLQEVDVMYHQIEKLMFVRLPVNYTDQLLSKLDIIKKAKHTQDGIELKNLVDTALSDLGHIFDKRIKLGQQINKLTVGRIEKLITEEDSIRKQLENIQNDHQELSAYMSDTVNVIDQLESKIPSATAQEKLSMRQEIVTFQLHKKDLINDLSELKASAKKLESAYNQIMDVLETYKNYNQSLMDLLIRVAEKTKQTETLIDQTLDLLKMNYKGIVVVKETLLESIKKSRDQLYKDRFEESKLNLVFIKYMTNQHLDIDTKWYPVIQMPYKNKILLESIHSKVFESNLKGFLENSEDLLNSRINSLILYEHVKEFPNKNSGEYTHYYKEQKKIEEKEIEVTENIKINKRTTFNERKKGSFWKVVLVDLSETVKVSVVTNEYILSTFKSYANPSLSDYDFFDKYRRAGYFNKGEIEYILMGDPSESINIMETTGLILGVRTVMNGLHIYTDTEKLTLSESIGVSVAGWTGFGAPLVSNVLRICWATGESFYDMSALIKGESVPFYKIYPDQWHFDLGVVYEENTLPNYLDLLSLTYHDYLRFMLLTLSNETKLKRIINLIELNLYKEDRIFDLSSYYTRVKIEDYQRGFYE